MKCVDCGYELQGLDRKGKCPECGLRIRRSAAVHRRNARPTSLHRDLVLAASGVLIAIVDVVLIAVACLQFPEVLFYAEGWFEFGLPAIAMLTVFVIACARRPWSEIAVFLFVLGMAVLSFLNIELVYWLGAVWGV